MALMNWSDDFVTGIEAIDQQHRHLVDLVNRSAPVLALDYRHNPQRAGELLDELTAYAVYHFKTEETLMADRHIDSRHRAHHAEVHRKFADSVADMRRRYENNDQLTGSDLLGFLANWLVFHILGEDQALARQLHAIDDGLSPLEAYSDAEGNRTNPANDVLSHALVDLYALMTEQNRHLLEMNRELRQHREHLEEQVALRTSDLAAARDAAEAANRAKSSFVANLSHEIRTPMNAIVGLTWMLYEQATDPEQKGKLQQVTNATQQLLGIINDLLDLSRIESEQLLLEPVDFSVRQLVDRLIADHTGKARQKGLSLETELPEQLPALLRGDADLIARIVGNFLSNAIKFTTRGSIKVIVGTQAMLAAGDTVELYIAVADTGIGIPAAQCERLFQPFEQVEQSTRRRFGGTGLGLAICRKLATLMGGTVGVSSEVDAGSVFWLRLPLTAVTLARPPEPARIRPPDQPASADLPEARELLQRLTCLLAEDDVQSIALWRESADLLRPALGPQAAHLEGEIFGYNFENALHIVERVLAEAPADS